MPYERIPGLRVNASDFHGPCYIVERDRVDGVLYSIRYTVMGRGDFPFDMLRYDMAHPADTASALAMARGETRDERRAVREITLITTRRQAWTPTFERWRSFGWIVKSNA